MSCTDGRQSHQSAPSGYGARFDPSIETRQASRKTNMIASLRGILIDKQADGAVIECGGVGHGVAMPLSGSHGDRRRGEGFGGNLHFRRTHRLLFLKPPSATFSGAGGSMVSDPSLRSRFCRFSVPKNSATSLPVRTNLAKVKILGVGGKKG